MDRDELLRKLVLAAVQPQRHGARARHVPRARRHAGGLPGLRGDGVPRAAVRRRGRAPAALRPADRRADQATTSSTSPIWPATHYNVKEGTMERAVEEIGRELNERCARARGRGQAARVAPPAPAHAVRHGDAARGRVLLGHRELLAHPGRRGCRARGRTACSTTSPKDFVCFIDESHQTVPQIGGMYEGDRSRKQTLVDYGFRLPSALDNRPQTFDEFLSITPQMVFVSATPGDYEREHSARDRRADRPPDRDRGPGDRRPRDARTRSTT